MCLSGSILPTLDACFGNLAGFSDDYRLEMATCALLQSPGPALF